LPPASQSMKRLLLVPQSPAMKRAALTGRSDVMRRDDAPLADQE
jgi:hypothetical protein